LKKSKKLNISDSFGCKTPTKVAIKGKTGTAFSLFLESEKAIVESVS
jgi:hypothetical protein